MAGINVKWMGGGMFLATDEAGHVLLTDPYGLSFKPPDLFLTSLVGCTGMTMVQILEKAQQKVSAIDVKVNQQNAPNPPWAIEKIEVEWTVRGRELKEKAVRDAVHLAEQGYCSVAASLKCALVTTVRVVNEDGGDG